MNPTVPSQQRARVSSAPAGFTLLEIGIALVLLSLLMAVAVPGMNALSGARLKEASGLIGGLIRDSYARTALLGRSTRLVFDLEQHAYWVEESEGVARVKRERIVPDRDGKVALDPLDERLEGIEQDTTDEEELTKMQVLRGPGFKPVEGEDGQPHRLPTDVRFKSIWIEHLDEVSKAGQAALYFYPGGYAEEAHITLTDDDDGARTLTLAVNGLTGEVQVLDVEPRIPNLDDGDD
jgi:prepilin-type N-terminal cleavage/methylation domain-containing protein